VEAGDVEDWQIWIGPAIGVAGLLFAIYAYIQNRKPKRLQYEIPTDQEIVSQSRYTRWADLSVRFGDRDLKHPRVVVVRVINTGKVEARDTDFDEPLAVSATRGAEIIAGTIALQRQGAEENRELEPASISPTEIVAPKLVLNEGEGLEFRLLVEGDKESVELQGHAAGFRLTRYTPSMAARRIISGWLLGLLSGLLLVPWLGVILGLATLQDVQALMTIVFAPIIGLVGAVVGFSFGERVRREG
jgi:hypothetical protein